MEGQLADIGDPTVDGSGGHHRRTHQEGAPGGGTLPSLEIAVAGARAGRQISASSSNRNFKGRQGSASGRTLLMSPAMVAAAAIEGRVSDVRALLNA